MWVIVNKADDSAYQLVVRLEIVGSWVLDETSGINKLESRQ